MAKPQLTLGGEPLLYDQDEQVAKYLRCFHPVEDLITQVHESVAVAGNRGDSRGHGNIGVLAPNYPPPPCLGINQLYWPTGASRWSQGYFLATEATKNKLVSSVAGNANSQELELKCDAGSSATITTDMYLVQAYRLSATGTGNNVWLLHVVDERYWWQFQNYGDKGLPSGISTWADLFSHLASQLGITITTSTISSDYLTPDTQELTRRYDNAAVMLDSIALSVGHRIVRDLSGFVLSLNRADNTERQSTNEATASFDLDWVLMAGGDDERLLVPEKITVVFNKAICKVPDCSRQTYAKTLSASSYDSTLTTVTGTFKTVHSALWANYLTSGAANPDNKSDCDTLADAVADDYYGWLSNTGAVAYGKSYAGIKNWIPLGQDDHTLYTLGAELEPSDTPFTHNFSTRVQALPLNFGVEQQLTNDVDIRVPEGLLAVQLAPGETLTASGSATAYQLLWDGGNWTADSSCTVTVYDPFGWTEFEENDKFWVRRGCDSGRFETVHPGTIQGGGGSGDTLYRLQAKDCFGPGVDQDSFHLMELSGGQWVDSGTDVTGYSSNGTVFLLPGEYAWSVLKSGRYELIGEQGLFRRATANKAIPANGTGEVTIVDHSSGWCAGLGTNCQVTICNGHSGLLQTRTILTGEYVFIRYLEGKWHAIYSPLENHRVQLPDTCKAVGADETFILLTYDKPTATWSDSGETILVQDPNNYVFMLPFETHWCVRHGGSYFFAAPYGLARKGRAYENISAYSSGTVRIWEHSSNCLGADSGCEVTACNGSSSNIEYRRDIAEDEYVFLQFYETKWHILPNGGGGCSIINAELDAPMCPTNTVGSITNVVVLCPPLPTAVPTIAYNTEDLSGEVGDTLKAVYNSVDDQWEILNVKHHQYRMVDECARISCDANGATNLELHFQEFNVLSKTCGVAEWEPCIEIIACDEDPCSPTTTATAQNMLYDEEPPDEGLLVVTPGWDMS